MSAPGIRDLLVRAVLDPDFRARVMASDAEAIKDYALTDAERTAVLGGGPEVLGLIGRLLEPADQGVSDDENHQPADTPPTGGNVLRETEGPPMRLLVRVMTGVEQHEGPEVRLRYGATLQPVPEGLSAADVPPTADAGPGGERLTDGRIEVVVVPKISRDEAGQLAVRYGCTARMVDEPSVEPVQRPAPEPISDLAERAAAIRAAPDGERQTLLLDLLARMEGSSGG
ncbi:MAG: hypothetical protein AAF183_21995 [Pseudomonadota bacterium]